MDSIDLVSRSRPLLDILALIARFGGDGRIGWIDLLGRMGVADCRGVDGLDHVDGSGLGRSLPLLNFLATMDGLVGSIHRVGWRVLIAVL